MANNLRRIGSWLLHRFPNLLVSPLYDGFFRLHRFPWRYNWRIYGFPVLYRKRGSNITIGTGLTLRSLASSNSIGVSQPVVLRTLRAGAELIIGDNVGASGCSIVAAERITIGNNVLLGSGSLITDNDAHPIDALTRQENPDDFASMPIVIGDDVFIGTRAIILKGVEIGRGAVIGAGAVVVKDVPPFTVAAGNPARFIKDLGRPK